MEPRPIEIPLDHPIAGRYRRAQDARHRALEMHVAAVRSGDRALIHATLIDAQVADALLMALRREYLRELDLPDDLPVTLKRTKSGGPII